MAEAPPPPPEVIESPELGMNTTVGSLLKTVENGRFAKFTESKDIMECFGIFTLNDLKIMPLRMIEDCVNALGKKEPNLSARINLLLFVRKYLVMYCELGDRFKHGCC